MSAGFGEQLKCPLLIEARQSQQCGEDSAARCCSCCPDCRPGAHVSWGRRMVLRCTAGTTPPAASAALPM